MGWFKKEVKAFSKEFAKQGSLLLFGKPKKKPYVPKRSGLDRYKAYKTWAKNNGFY